MLHSIGIRDDQMRTVAKTGLVVDIYGEADESFDGEI